MPRGPLASIKTIGPEATADGCEFFLVPGQTWPASLTASAEARKFSWYPASLAGVPDGLRGLGNVQRRVLELSEPSETFSGAF